MNIEYLNEFIVLSKKLNYHDAAKELCISQSALSKHISALENYFGIPLFVRSKHQIHLTDGGIFLLERFLEIWNLFEDSKQVAEEHFRNERRFSCGGIIDSAGDYAIVAYAESLFKESNPHNVLHLARCMTADIEVHIISLLSDEVDCIAAYNALDAIAPYEQLEYEHINAIPLEVTVSKRNPLAQKALILPEDLTDLKLTQIIGSRYSQLWAQIEKLLNKNEIHYLVKPIIASSTYDYISSLQNIEDTVAYIAPFRSTPTTVLKDPNTVTIPIARENFTFDLGVIYKKEKHNELLDQFIQALRESYTKFLSKTP